MTTQVTVPAAGGFSGDPAEAFHPPAAGDCCGASATGTGPTAGPAGVCCGTAAEAEASGGCCGASAKSEAIAADAACCG